MRRALRTVTASLVLMGLVGYGAVSQELCTVIVPPGALVQAFIDEALPGTVICLSEGEWEEHLVVGKSLTLRGAGEGTTIRGHERDLPVIHVHTQGEGEVAVVLEGMTVTGGRGSRSGVYLEGHATVTMERVSLHGNERHGIVLEDRAQVTIRDSMLSDNTWHGIVLAHDARATITASTISGNRRNGLLVLSGAAATITNSVVAENGWYGFVIADAANMVIEDCTVRGNRDGIALGGDTRVTISRCSVSDNEQGIVVIERGEAAIHDCTIFGNTEGIVVENMAQATITGSTVFANSDGIVLGGHAHVAISDCAVFENNDGIVLWGMVQATIDGCTVTGNERYGVALYEEPCYEEEGALFMGYVTGMSNVIPGPEEPEGNVQGAFCPQGLAFLGSDERLAFSRLRIGGATQVPGLLFYVEHHDGMHGYYFGTDVAGAYDVTHVVKTNNRGAFVSMVVFDAEGYPLQWVFSDITMAVMVGTDVVFDPRAATHLFVLDRAMHYLNIDIELDMTVDQLLDIVPRVYGGPLTATVASMRQALETHMPEVLFMTVREVIAQADTPNSVALGVWLAMAGTGARILATLEVMAETGRAPMDDDVFTFASASSIDWRRVFDRVSSRVAGEILSKAKAPMAGTINKGAGYIRDIVDGSKYDGRDIEGPAVSMLICRGASYIPKVCNQFYMPNIPGNASRCTALCFATLECFVEICHPMKFSVEDAQGLRQF